MQTEIQSYTIGKQTVSICIPDGAAIQNAYRQQHAPYWAQVWHAAIGLCLFLEQYPEYFENKKVLELGAGLGLPGIAAAAKAKNVCISDISPEAITIVQQSILHCQLKNVTCQIIAWDNIDSVSIPEVVLLSDVNYESDAFASLLKMIEYLLNNNCTVILSTPQRLMAKPFIEQLLINCITQATIPVLLREKQEDISVFVLVKK